MPGNEFSIVCPHCHQEVSLDDAFTHKISEKLEKEFSTKLEQEKQKLGELAREKAEQSLKEKYELETKLAREELGEEKKRSKELLQQLTETNRLLRELKRKDEERTLQAEKEQFELEEKVRAESTKKAQEEQHLKLLEKDKQLQDALKVNAQLQRKLQQGSQQNQGEVLELELEKILKHKFPNDNISPVGKGIRGADLIQEVWDRTGVRCGTILWESKNAKWTEVWLDKLKEDQRNLKAEIAVIISEYVPQTVKGAAYRNGVWVAERDFAIGIGMALRANLIQAHFIRRTVSGKNEKKEVLWNYLTGTEFQQRMQAIAEAFYAMKLELEKEKIAYTRIWAKREKLIERMQNSSAGLRGDLEGLMGNALPEMKNLELPNGVDQSVEE